jgi:hypothetical protein
MNRFERNALFERLVELRAGYGAWAQDTEAVLSIADAITYAEAVLSAAAADDEAWPEDGEDATPTAPIHGLPETAVADARADHPSGPASRDATDGRPRPGRFFRFPGPPLGGDPA